MATRTGKSAEARAGELHRRAAEEINRGRPSLGARTLRTALRLLDWQESAPASELTIRVLGNLAAAEVAQGHTDRGFALLDNAERSLADENRGILAHHRGLLLLMVGRMREALDHLDRAATLLRGAQDNRTLATTLLNRALLHQLAGRASAAIVDLDDCERLSVELGNTLQAAKATHGRGACELLTGDVPAALRSLDRAATGYADADADGMQAVLAVDKARALLVAGLHSEAGRELDGALSRFPRVHMDQEHAEAELVRAHVALLAGDPTQARSWAHRAERRFRRRGNMTWAAVAALTTRRAEFACGRPPVRVAADATDLAGNLYALGLDNDAERAELLAARASIVRGDFAKARHCLRGRDSARSALETRLERRLARAELGSASGDFRATFANARAGLAIIEEHRRSFGSVEFKTSTTALGAELARIGLAEALDRGSPALVFRWLELSRAQAFRLPAVRPAADPGTVAAVAELRQLVHRVRTAELASRRDVEAARGSAELKRLIRAKGWQTDGRGEHRAPAEFDEVCAGLAREHSILLSFLCEGDQLRVLVAAGCRAQLCDLGAVGTVTEAATKLRSDLDVLCGRRVPAALRAVVNASVTQQLAVLSEHLLAPVRGLLADLDVVLVPTGPLSALPWGLLPELRGRPVTVTPSASVWQVAARPGRAGTPLLVAGPNLDHAPEEVARIAGIHPDATVLRGPHATVENTLVALRGRTTVHVAAHGHHEPDNVLFSRLDLADGPLMAYDIQQLDVAPEHVVLSCCDVGRTVVRTGDESLGFTAALLYGGTRTVVSSVARVDDLEAVDVMDAYHRAVRAGVPPARSLADATGASSRMPFVCFGRG
jgi:tetratricopeptide (TPR) repeat protein